MHINRWLLEDMMKKIAITGPESTGKSMLARQLADHYKTLFVPEYARAYIDKLDRSYQQSDIVEIARGQLAMEKALEKKANRYLFCDTELIVNKVWSLHAYGICDPFILDGIVNNRYDLFLLCDVDLPWEADPQREHPHLRSYFFDWYRKELDSYHFPYEIIRGVGPERFEQAVGILDELQ